MPLSVLRLVSMANVCCRLVAKSNWFQQVKLGSILDATICPRYLGQCLQQVEVLFDQGVTSTGVTTSRSLIETSFLPPKRAQRVARV